MGFWIAYTYASAIRTGKSTAFRPPHGMAATLRRDAGAVRRYDGAMTYPAPTPKEEMLLHCARIGFDPPA